MEIVLLGIGILGFLVSIIWFIVQPGFSPLIAFLTGLAAFIGSWRIYKQRIGQNAVLGVNSTRKSVPYDILPIAFDLRLRQQIPSIDIWLYVVNYEPKELVLQTFLIPSFHLQSGLSIDTISMNQDVRVPARQSCQILCRRNLIDSEVRAIEQTQQQAVSQSQPNATFSVVTRGFAGRKRLSRDIPPLSMNGWAKDIPAQSGKDKENLPTGDRSSHSESQETTDPVLGKHIRYDSVIRLIHDTTGNSLHSHSHIYEHDGTSGQQQVTASFSYDENDYWTVKGPHDSPETYKMGDPVRHGDVIRLEHRMTSPQSL